MSTFEERQRARVNALLAETMDDVASEMRKAVTPPAKASGSGNLSGYEHVLTDLPNGYRPRDIMPVGVRQEFDHYVYVNFSSPEFEKWFGEWFVKQIRIHGGLKRWLPR